MGKKKGSHNNTTTSASCENTPDASAPQTQLTACGLEFEDISTKTPEQLLDLFEKHQKDAGGVASSTLYSAEVLLFLHRPSLAKYCYATLLEAWEAREKRGRKGGKQKPSKTGEGEMNWDAFPDSLNGDFLRSRINRCEEAEKRYFNQTTNPFTASFRSFHHKNGARVTLIPAPSMAREEYFDKICSECVGATHVYTGAIVQETADPQLLLKKLAKAQECGARLQSVFLGAKLRSLLKEQKVGALCIIEEGGELPNWQHVAAYIRSEYNMVTNLVNKILAIIKYGSQTGDNKNDASQGGEGQQEHKNENEIISDCTTRIVVLLPPEGYLNWFDHALVQEGMEEGQATTTHAITKQQWDNIHEAFAQQQ